MTNNVSAGSRSRVAVVLERLIRHHRAEIGAADPDIDDVANALAGVTLPGPAAHAITELAHPVEHRMDFGHDVFAVDEDGRALRGAQRDMQHGAVFRDIDSFAAEHGIDPGAQC